MPASLPANPQTAPCSEPEQLIDTLRQQVIGQDTTLQTPFGERPLIYCDHTASGRSLHSIEELITREVLPHYANTHSEASHTGRHTGRLREWARQSIKEVINAGPEDALIFCGHGATGAVNTLVHLLNFNAAPQADNASNPNEAEKPLVLIGPYEHHSNELPWREAQVDVVRIPLDEDGNINQQDLIRTLEENATRPLIVGSFSAASNVTGIKTDVPGITQILKRHGAIAVWDYAAGAPYLPIDMNRPDAAIDAVFFSPHKFIGGPGSSGVLAVKRSVIRSTAPGQVGGGTVRYVTPDWHDWHPDPEHREEGGTPGIIESIRGAMAVSIPGKLGYQRLAEIEHKHVLAAREVLLNTRGLELLGSPNSDRLPIFSVRFRSAEGELHYGFVVRLLNDLFGIQARGGCSCAGPYGHSLLQLTPEYSSSLADAVADGYGCLRPVAGSHSHPPRHRPATTSTRGSAAADYDRRVLRRSSPLGPECRKDHSAISRQSRNATHPLLSESAQKKSEGDRCSAIPVIPIHACSARLPGRLAHVCVRFLPDAGTPICREY